MRYPTARHGSRSQRCRQRKCADRKALAGSEFKCPVPRKPAGPFSYFNSSPEVSRLIVMMHVSFPLSLRNVERVMFQRGIDICRETVRHWWNRTGILRRGDFLACLSAPHGRQEALEILSQDLCDILVRIVTAHEFLDQVEHLERVV